MSIIFNPHEREAVEATIRKRFTGKQIDAAFAAQDGCCAHCREPIGGQPFICDHIIPLELGGPHAPDNLQLLCVMCDAAKTREDIKRIRKAQRLERDADPSTRRRSQRPIKSRGFEKDPLR